MLNSTIKNSGVSPGGRRRCCSEVVVFSFKSVLVRTLLVRKQVAAAGPHKGIVTPLLACGAMICGYSVGVVITVRECMCK